MLSLNEFSDNEIINFVIFVTYVFKPQFKEKMKTNLKFSAIIYSCFTLFKYFMTWDRCSAQTVTQ